MDSLRANRSNGSCSSRATKPFEHGGFDLRELGRIEHAEFANRASESTLSEFRRDPDFLRGFSSLFHFGAIKWDRRLMDIQERPQFEDVRVTVSAKRGVGR